MAQIEYCDEETTGPLAWHPSVEQEACPDTKEDEWFRPYVDRPWRPDPDVILVEVIQKADDGLRREFTQLAKDWREGTKFSPTLKKMVIHPAYQRIMALGKPVVPHILEDLQRETDHWFWALHFITGEDPAKGAETIEDAAAAWLRWGRQAGYIR
jgi:hypothetical protein